MENRKKATIILALIIIIIAVACIGAYIYYQPVIKSKVAISKTMSALRTCDLDSAKAHVNSDILKKDSILVDIKSRKLTKKQIKQLEKDLFSNLNYEVVSVERKNSTTAVVKAKIKNVNMKTVVDDWYEYVSALELKYAYSDSDNAEAQVQTEALNSFTDAVKQVKASGDYHTDTVNITVSKNAKGKWIIAGNDKLYDAILGGMVVAVKNLSDK